MLCTDDHRLVPLLIFVFVSKGCGYRKLEESPAPGMFLLFKKILNQSSFVLDDPQFVHGAWISRSSISVTRVAPFINPLFSSQAHGYATEEFEVTAERLGVYLPVWIPLNTILEGHS
jgi:hypothetical protein